MASRKSLLYFCLFFAVMGVATAQSVFVLPGTGGVFNNIQVFSAGALGPVGSFAGSPDSVQVIPQPDGSKYYVVAESGSATVTKVDSAFGNPVSLGNFGTQAEGAALTPDGKFLYVAAGKVQVIDTKNDQLLFTGVPIGGLTVGGAGATAIDVAVALDSSKAFVLTTTQSGTSMLTALSTANNSQAGTLNIPGTATGVAVAPNGLVYVSTLNLIEAINPATMAVVGQISLNASPGKLSFTPDGLHAVTINSTPITGGIMLVLDLVKNTLVATVPLSAAPNNDTFSNVYVAGNGLVFPYSAVSKTLYQVSLSGLTLSQNPTQPLTLQVTQPTFAQAFPSTNINAVVVSTDVPAGSRSTAASMFVASGTTLAKIVLANSALAGQATLSNTPTVLAFAQPTQTGAAVTTLLTFGDKQVVGTGAASLPLVVQALDAQGNPLAGIPVAFSATGGGVLSSSNVTTGARGYATTTVTAPSTPGAITVSANAGGVTQQFTVNVSGAGSGGTAYTLTVVQGQGEVVNPDTNTALTGTPIVVQVTDPSGNPVPNIPVTFKLQKGGGSILGGTSTAPNTTVVASDRNGNATLNFLSSSPGIQPGFENETITATAAGITTNIYITTVNNTGIGSGASISYVNSQSFSLSGVAGQKLVGAIQAIVVSSVGFAIPNINIQLLPGPNTTAGDAVCSGTPLSNSKGLVSCDVVLGSTPGDFIVRPQVGNLVTLRPISITITAGTPSAIKAVSGSGQTGNPGTTLAQPLVANVTDAAGNSLGGAPVTWAVTSGAATLVNPSATTDENGQVTASVQLGSAPGPVVITATAAGQAATFNVSVNVVGGGIAAVSGTGQSAPIGSAFGQPLVVKVIDTTNAPLPGASVSFAVTSGSATLAPQSATTDANGLAQAAVTAGAVPGAITITATYGSFTTTFSLTALPAGPSNLAFVNGATFQSRGSAPGSVSPGEILAITGKGLATDIQGVVTPQSPVGPLPTTLAGVQVTFNNTPAPIFSVSNVNGQEQVNVQVPFEVSGSTTATVVVSVSGGSTTLDNVPVVALDPGIFSFTSDSKQYGVVVKTTDGTYVTPANPAHAGDKLILYLTGAGALTPAALTGATGTGDQIPAQTIIVGVNNQGVPVLSAQYAPGLVGVFAVTFEVPAGVLTRTPQGLPANTFALGVQMPDPVTNKAVFAQGSTLISVAP